MDEPSSYRRDPVAPAIRLLSYAIAGLAMLGGAGCGAFREAPLGTFASSGGLLGTWSKTSYYCGSSVDSVVSSVATHVVFADNHHQWFALSTGKYPGRNIVLVHTSDPLRMVGVRTDACRRFEVQHVPQPDGRLGADIELDCDTEDGSRVTASLHAQRCR